MSTTQPILFAALLACACDLIDVPQTKEHAQAGAAQAGAAQAPSAAKAAALEDPGPFTSMSECLLACEHEQAIPTNRETCRLNCDAAYGAPQTRVTPVVLGGAVETDPVGQAATCMGRCYTGAEGEPRSCVGACKAMASGGGLAGPGSAGLDHLASCVATCHADKQMIPTNRATCELNCAEAARVRVEDPRPLL